MKQSLRIRILIASFLFVLLQGCLPVPPRETIPVVSETNFPSQELTVVPSKSFTATETFTTSPQATDTTTPNSPTVEISSANFDRRCVDLLSELPEPSLIQGQLILEPGAGNTAIRPSPKFISIGSRSAAQLPYEWYSFSTSPDRKNLTYSFFKGEGSSSLVEYFARIIINGPDSMELTIPYEEGWFDIDWLDNENLKIFRRRTMVQSSGLGDLTIDLLPSVIVYNILTKERRELTPDFPDITTQEIAIAGHIIRPEYDPGLTRVVYPGEPPADDPLSIRTGYGIYRLRNLESGEILASVATGDIYEHRPAWSPDGTNFVIAGMVGENHELFLVSREGDIVRLTEITSVFSEFDIGELSWSPDGKKIAFWLREGLYSASTPDNIGQTLLILDLDQMKIIDYCIPGNRKQFEKSVPVWSPDSRYLAVVAYDIQSSSDYTIFVDTVAGYGVDLGSGYFPSVWIDDSLNLNHFLQ